MLSTFPKIDDHGSSMVGASTGGIHTNDNNIMDSRMSLHHRHRTHRSSSSRSSPEDSMTYITVSDPVIHADGMNKYTSYRVECRPPPTTTTQSDTNDNIPSSNNSSGNRMGPFHPSFSSVLRRYSDFLWLYEHLHKERAGAIIPPLPDKQAVSRFSPEFVEDRRVALEIFLRRVICHPELGDASCLLTFLRAEDLEFQHVKKSMGSNNRDVVMLDYYGGSDHTTTASPSNTTTSLLTSLGGAGAFNLNPQKNTASLKKWFSEAKTTLSNDLVSSPDDDLFDEIERYVETLSIQMKRVSNQASSLVRKSRQIANGYFEFSLAFHQLAQSEGGELGTKLQHMGGTTDTLSSLALRQSEGEIRELDDPFKDYVKMIHGVKMALHRRHEKRVSYTALLQEIQGREMNLHRLRMTPGCEAKAYSAEMSLQRYHTMAHVSKEEYAECSQRVLREVDRFKREKAEEMRYVVLDFIMLEIEMNRAMEQVWAELIPKLEDDEEEEVVVVQHHHHHGGGNDDDDEKGEDVDRRQQSLVQVTKNNSSMPPHPPPPRSTNAPPSYSNSMDHQPIQYSNVSSSSVSTTGAGGGEIMSSNLNHSTNMMQSSIEYRDYTHLPEMGI